MFIGPYACVIRADDPAVNEQGFDMEAIATVIKRDTNIQDGVVIHSKAGAAVTIGERSSIALLDHTWVNGTDPEFMDTLSLQQ